MCSDEEWVGECSCQSLSIVSFLYKARTTQYLYPIINSSFSPAVECLVFSTPCSFHERAVPSQTRTVAGPQEISCLLVRLQSVSFATHTGIAHTSTQAAACNPPRSRLPSDSPRSIHPSIHPSTHPLPLPRRHPDAMICPPRSDPEICRSLALSASAWTRHHMIVRTN